MKVLFIDFDGVLCSDRYARENQNEDGVLLDPSKMEILKAIIDRTDAKIVLSTSWRGHWSKTEDGLDATGRQMNEIFASYGIEIFDKIPKLNIDRAEEIRLWLDGNEVEAFAVLDDMFLDAPYLRGHFVKVASFRALDSENAEETVKILNA